MSLLFRSGHSHRSRMPVILLFKVVTELLAASAPRDESQSKPGRVAKLHAREEDHVSVVLGEN